MLRKLRQLETTKNVALKWQSIFTSIVIISNRAMPSHQDLKRRPEWFDGLLNYSGVGNRAQLLIKDLELTLEYSTGTVVGFCRLILQHEVSPSGNSDRVCYVHFMWESVRKRLDVPPASRRVGKLQSVQSRINRATRAVPEFCHSTIRMENLHHIGNFKTLTKTHGLS
jgi:hypothetical protein